MYLTGVEQWSNGVPRGRKRNETRATTTLKWLSSLCNSSQTGVTYLSQNWRRHVITSHDIDRSTKLSRSVQVVTSVTGLRSAKLTQRPDQCPGQTKRRDTAIVNQQFNCHGQYDGWLGQLARSAEVHDLSDHARMTSASSPYCVGVCSLYTVNRERYCTAWSLTTWHKATERLD